MSRKDVLLWIAGLIWGPVVIGVGFLYHEAVTWNNQLEARVAAQSELIVAYEAESAQWRICAVDNAKWQAYAYQLADELSKEKASVAFITRRAESLEQQVEKVSREYKKAGTYYTGRTIARLQRERDDCKKRYETLYADWMKFNESEQ